MTLRFTLALPVKLTFAIIPFFTAQFWLEPAPQFLLSHLGYCSDYINAFVKVPVYTECGIIEIYRRWPLLVRGHLLMP